MQYLKHQEIFPKLRLKENSNKFYSTSDTDTDRLYYDSSLRGYSALICSNKKKISINKIT